MAPLGFVVQRGASVAVEVQTTAEVSRYPVVLGQSCEVLLARTVKKDDGRDLALGLGVHPALRLSVFEVPGLRASERSILLQA